MQPIRTNILRTRFALAVLALPLMLAPGRSARADNIKLTFGAATISFVSAATSATTAIPALQNPIPIEVRVAPPQGEWVLTLSAVGDLVSGADSIPISSISWRATGASFVDGTLSRTTPVTLGSGVAAPRGSSGSLSFFFASKPHYPVGDYSQTITFTAVSF